MNKKKRTLPESIRRAMIEAALAMALPDPETHPVAELWYDPETDQEWSKRVERTCKEQAENFLLALRRGSVLRKEVRIAEEYLDAIRKKP